MANHEERAMPASLRDEKFILGSILLQGNSTLAAVESMLSVEDFAIETHRRIFAAMKRMDLDGGRIDHATVADHMQNHSELESVGGFSYLVELDTGLPLIANLNSYVETVREKSTLRKLIYAFQAGIDKAMLGSDCTDLIANATGILDRLSQRDEKQANWQTPAQIIESHTGGLSALISPAKYATGIGTPWDSVNYFVCGMNPGELILLAGRPSHGKSAAALQIAYNAAINGKSVAYLSLEMNKAALVRRLICLVSKVDMNRMKHGYLNPEEKARIIAAADYIRELPLHIEERMGHNLPALRMGLRKLRASGVPLELVVVDHFHKLQRVGNEDLREHYNLCADELHRYSKEFECPFLVLAQLNRKCEEENRAPGLSDLAETAKLEQNADIVMFTHRPELYAKNRRREDLRGIAEFIIGKQRDGQVGNVEMVFLGHQQRFEEAAQEARESVA